MASTTIRERSAEWHAAGIYDILQRHEVTCCNVEPDSFETERGDWYVCDDDTFTIVYGTFSDCNSPGTMGTAEVYDCKEEYYRAVQEWQAQPEYVELNERDYMVDCVACEGMFDREDMRETEAGDYICPDCVEEAEARERQIQQEEMEHAANPAPTPTE